MDVCILTIPMNIYEKWIKQKNRTNNNKESKKMSTQRKIAIAEKSSFIKIHSSDVIENIRKGNVWLTSLQYYRDLYKNSKDDTIGDPYEGLFIVNNFEFISSEMPQYNSNGIVEQCAFPTSNQYDYVFCLFSVQRALQNTSEFFFNDEQKENLLKFGDTALIFTDSKKFAEKMYSAAKEKNYNLSRGDVTYYDQRKNDFKRYLSLIKDKQNIVFHKTDKYKYQQEHRFTIPFHGEYSDDKKFLTDISIGDISDITEVVSTEQLLNCFIREHI